MGHDLATRAELAKLARTLGTTMDGVAFAAGLEPGDIRRLRQRVSTVLDDQHRAAFQRVAAITRLLPVPLNVRIALRAYPPLLAARVAAEMAPDRAAELANRMPVGYLAEGCLHLDPRRAAPLLSRIRPERALAVAQHLVARGEYIALGLLLDAAAEHVVRDVAATISDEALLRIGIYAESTVQLTRAVSVLSPQRLRRIVGCALAGPPDLRSAGLALIGRLEDDELRGRLATYAAEADDETLTRLLHTAIDDGALGELLIAVAAMNEQSRRRVLTLPVLAEHDVLVHLIKATATHNLWERLLPLVAHMPDEFRQRLAATEPDRRGRSDS